MSLFFSTLSPFASRSRAGLYLVKAIFLVFFVFTFLPRPVQAQGLPPGWVAYPCDANGGSISACPNNGFYTMSGNEAISVNNSYPAPYLRAVDYYSGNPVPSGTDVSTYGSTPNGPIPGTILYQGVSAQANAYNYDPDGYCGWYYTVNPTMFGTPSSGFVNGSYTSNATGQLFYYFKVSWGNQGAPTSPIPDHLDLLLKTTVQATASAGYGASAQTGGLSAIATASDDQFNENVTATGGFINTPAPVVGYHLVRASVDPGTGVAEVYLNGTVNTNAVNSVPYGTVDPQSSMNNRVTNGQTLATAFGSVAGVVRTDSREVEITSPDIETSYQFGPLDPNTNTYPQNVRASDGSIVTDSAVSPPLTQPGGGSSWTASPGMLGQAGGFTNPVFAWSMAGGQGSLSASGNTSHTQLSVQFPLSSTDTALNKQSTVRLDVTDSDSATAANTFTVRWHYPKESAALYSSGTPFWQPAALKQVTAVGLFGGSATGIFGYSTYTDFFPTASSDIFGVGSNLPPSPWSAFIAAVGLLASQVQPTETSYSCDFENAWNSPYSTGVPVPNDPSLMNQYQMGPLVVVEYQEQQWQYQQYGQHGYLGPAIEGFNKFLGSAETAGSFTKLTSPPSGG